MWQFIDDRREQIIYNTLQHLNLTVQAVLLGSVIAVLLAAAVLQSGFLSGVANTFSAVGLTIPSFALIGLLLPFFGIGPMIGFIAITFYASLVVLRNAVVGLSGVDPNLIESARGMGMNDVSSFFRVRLPLAWPVILAGVRTSMQMSMGIAAIAAYTLGPGLGGYIFTGVNAGASSANGLNYALVGTIGIILVALVADLLLKMVGRLTISKGISA